MRRHSVRTYALTFCLAFFASPTQAAETKPSGGIDVYRDRVAPIFRKYCGGCHNDEEAKGDLDLSSYSSARRGGESGPLWIARQSKKSQLLSVLRGGKPKMPPGKRKGPSAGEVAILEAWIDAGAKAPLGGPRSTELLTPKILPLSPPPRPVTAVAVSSDLYAIGRYGDVELRRQGLRSQVARLNVGRGPVTSLQFSKDETLLVAASGEPGLRGRAVLWDATRGELRREFVGHNDSLYAVALSPDATLLATGSYDRHIVVWDVATGAALRKLVGHNGAVFDLAFRSDGRVLASASDDATVKLWDAQRGKRLETFAAPLGAVYAVAFSPSGDTVFAGGADHRVRAWRVSPSATEGSNPLLYSRFAHEGTILKIETSDDGKRILSSADDRSVKVWSAGKLTEERLLERQPDWVSALAVARDSRSVLLGRQDGSVAFYDVERGLELRLSRRDARIRGKAVLASAAEFLSSTEAVNLDEKDKPKPKPKPPELSRLEPRSVQRGVTAQVRLIGSRFEHATSVRSSDDQVAVKLVQRKNGLFVEVSSPRERPRGTMEIWLSGPHGESGKRKLFVDDLRQVVEKEPNDSWRRATIASAVPVTVNGTIERGGDVDHFAFEVKDASETLVVDVAAARRGSKLDAVLSLLDDSGRVLAMSNDYEGKDPFLALEVPKPGRYRLRIEDLRVGASAEHFYSVSIGALPFVEAVFPASGTAGSELTAKLAGYHLDQASVRVKVGDKGATAVPVPASFRTRKSFSIRSSSSTEFVESEPNSEPAQALKLGVPAAACGQLWSKDGEDLDLYSFRAEAGRDYVIEVEARRIGSPVDSRIEILHADGSPVIRTVLQATRDSYINFRPIDANGSDVRVKNWEEMDLDQYLYFRGEVSRIFRMPRGPDSGFQLYQSSGKRRLYFGTTATTHPNGEVCYVVEPHDPDERIVPNGLPVFPIPYANDDDSLRQLASDSRLLFRARESTTYLIRVSDARGGNGSARAQYRVVLREAKPDFRASLSGPGGSVPRGSGKSFKVSVDRFDGFEGEVQIDVRGMPKGFVASTPLSIEAGHRSASGCVFVQGDAKDATDDDWKKVEIVVKAKVGGKTVEKNIGSFGKIKIGGAPQARVALQTEGSDRTTAAQIPEIRVVAGSESPARLQLSRNGHKGLATFSVDNLPHGVIVGDIGLNGVLLPAGENDRTIFLQCARWVKPMRRLCYAVCNQAGRQTSSPVWLVVIKE
ncbi:MAG: c-type cytochrome domain-containing protein [Planctomycetota bacterium]